MYFYKISFANDYDHIICKCDKEYKEHSLVIDFAVKTDILPANFYFEDLVVTEVEDDDYTKYLLENMQRHFQNKLDGLLDEIRHLPTDKICHKCYEIVYVQNIVCMLDSDDSAHFDFEVLEKWLAEPDEMVLKLVHRVSNADYSSINDMICDLIDNGTED